MAPHSIDFDASYKAPPRFFNIINHVDLLVNDDGPAGDEQGHTHQRVEDVDSLVGRRLHQVPWKQSQEMIQNCVILTGIFKAFCYHAVS